MTEKKKSETAKKILVAYYSRTGTTKKAAEAIAAELNCETEEIKDTKERKGILGYLRSGRDATKRYTTELKPLKKNPAAYDLVVVGTPIWSWNVTPPARTFLRNNKAKLKNVAFFCTMGGSGSEKAFKEMETECGRKPVATLALLTKAVVSSEFKEKTRKFAKDIQGGKRK